MGAFPADFVWGAATAAYQVEGSLTADGRGPSIWDTFAQTPGAILDGSSGEGADDHYHRYPHDIALMASLGLRAYRFSIAWPRVLPEGGGRVNQAGLDHYRRMAETCLQHGITPYATLYHWDLPQPLEDAGGWLHRDTAQRFADYAAITAEALADVIGHWITLNEPWCSAFLGYAAGVHAPGKTLGAESFKAVHHLLLGHGLAMPALRAAVPSGQHGITVNLYPVRPASDAPGDEEAARRIDGLANRVFLDPLLLGRYPADVLADVGMTDWFAERTEDLATISAPIDFMGVNYYSQHTVAAPEDGGFADPGVATSNPGSERIRFVDTGAAKTAMGWEVHPTGIIEVLQMVRDRAPDLPLYVTENGAAYEDQVDDGLVDDHDRRRYFALHVDACRTAIDRGIPLRGYFAWSLLDNFEWSYGYSKRFGIVYVDYETQERIVKSSGLWFREFLSA